MSYNAEGLKAIAMLNKRDLKNKFFNIAINDTDYKFKVSGVGNRSIKIEKYFYYSEIMKPIANGSKDGFEYEIEQAIAGSDVIGTPYELRDLALSRKTKLKNKYVDVIIENKYYEFRIAGIGFKSIKIELFLGYDEIIKSVSSGSAGQLELIFMELITGEKIVLEDINEDSKNDDLISKKGSSNVGDESEVDTNKLKKLSDDEFDKIMLNVKGWNKLVFDSIEDIIGDTFTFDELMQQKRILSYQSRGENLGEKVLENLNQLIDLGLIFKINKTTYFKLW